MNKLLIIRQGESVPFSFDRGGNSIDNWVCTVYLKEKPSDANDAFMTPRVVPPSNGSWPGFITQSESSALTPLAKGAAYYLIAALVNVTTDEEEIVTDRIRVTTAWV